jgi:hypothetical protein
MVIFISLPRSPLRQFHPSAEAGSSTSKIRRLSPSPSSTLTGVASWHVPNQCKHPMARLRRRQHILSLLLRRLLHDSLRYQSASKLFLPSHSLTGVTSVLLHSHPLAQKDPGQLRPGFEFYALAFVARMCSGSCSWCAIANGWAGLPRSESAVSSSYTWHSHDAILQARGLMLHCLSTGSPTLALALAGTM